MRVCVRNYELFCDGGLTQEVYDSYCTNETKLRYIEFIYSLLTNRNYMDYIPKGKAQLENVQLKGDGFPVPNSKYYVKENIENLDLYD